MVVGVHVFQLEIEGFILSLSLSHTTTRTSLHGESEKEVGLQLSLVLAKPSQDNSDSRVTGESATRKSNIYRVPVMSKALGRNKVYLSDILTDARARERLGLV